MVDAEEISGKMAKSVFEEMFSSGHGPKEIVNAKGLKQLSDDNELLAVIQKEFDTNPEQLGNYLSGNERLHGFFVGQVMKATGGSANPKKVNALIKQEAERRKATK
jgi:Asp-tRNA(Asn)/Glu-tRNA(Gln) amidotransferase B subunit